MKVQTLIEQAQLLADNENFEKAFELLKTAYDLDKSNTDVLEKLALSAQTLEKMEDAASYWEALIDIDPNSLVAYSELQDIYFHKDKYKYYLTRAKTKILQENIGQAVPDYKKAIDNTTNEKEIVDARLLLAKTYEFLHKNSNAIDEYFKILDYGDNLAVYYKIAELYSDNDKYAAIDILERAVNAYPEESNLKELLAGLFIETSQLDEAKKYVQSDLTKAKICLMQGNNQEASEVLTAIDDKTSPQYIMLMAEYFFNVKDFEKCSEMINRFKKLESQNPLVYQMTALVFEEKNDLFNAHYNWGLFYNFKKDYQMALSEFLQAHNIQPDNALAIKEIIKINENAEDKTSLVEFYEKLIAIEPQNESALINLGKFYLDMYEFKNALRYFEKLESSNSRNVEVLKDIALCYEKLKNNILAKEYYQKYVDRSPLTPEVEQIKHKLSKMTDDNFSEDEGLLEKIMKIFSR